MQERVMKDLRGRAIAARDGDIGAVRDVYFDDATWIVRYVVVDTGRWLSGRKVLLAPPSLELQPGRLAARLERSQVETAPDISEDMPVSRLYEEAHARHFGYPPYWTEPYVWGLGPMAGASLLAEDPEDAARREQESARLEAQAASSSLRSCDAVAGYRIRAADGLVGHVEDFVVDGTWRIVQILVDTNDWLPGGKVMVSPAAVEGIDWHAREMRVALNRESLRNAPEAEARAELRARPGPPPQRPAFRTDMDFRDET